MCLTSVVTEQADDRSWRTLPERISVARAILPHGRQTVEFQTGAGAYRTEVNIGSRFTIVPIRLTGGAVYVGQPNVAIESAQSTSSAPDARPQVRGVRGKPAKAAATQ